jgi:hypothetical protein
LKRSMSFEMIPSTTGLRAWKKNEMKLNATQAAPSVLEQHCPHPCAPIPPPRSHRHDPTCRYPSFRGAGLTFAKGTRTSGTSYEIVRVTWHASGPRLTNRIWPLFATSTPACSAEPISAARAERPIRRAQASQRRSPAIRLILPSSHLAPPTWKRRRSRLRDPMDLLVLDGR